MTAPEANEHAAGARWTMPHARARIRSLFPTATEEKRTFRAVLSGARWTLLFRVFAGAAGLGISMLSARLLGAAGYGELQYVLGILNVLMVLGGLGLARVITRETAVGSNDAAWSRSKGIVLLAIPATALTTLLLAAIGGALAVHRIEGGLLALFAIGTGATVLRQGMLPLTSFLAGLARLDLAGAGDFVRHLLLLTALGLFYLAAGSRGFDPSLVMWLRSAAAAAALVVLVTLAYRAARRLPGHPLRVAPVFDAKGWLAAGAPLIVVAGAATFFANADMVMLGSLVSPTSVGPYHAATRAAELVSFAYAISIMPLAPVVARLHGAGKLNELRRAVRGTMAITIPAGLCVAAVLMAFSGTFLGLFGPAFVTATTVLHILVAAQIVNILAGPVQLLLVMTGNQKAAALGVVVAAASNVLLNAMLIPRFGAEGAAVATAISMAVWNTLLFAFVRRRVWG